MTFLVIPVRYFCVRYLFLINCDFLYSKDPRNIDVRKLVGIGEPLPTKLEPPKMRQLWELAGGYRNIIRLAGLFGASAVVLGAYGAHSKFTLNFYI